jgi:hypothetical protein
LNGGADDRNARSQLAIVERIALPAFPKDAEARKRIRDAARERIAHHRRRGARFDRAKVGESKRRACCGEATNERDRSHGGVAIADVYVPS